MNSRPIIDHPELTSRLNLSQQLGVCQPLPGTSQMTDLKQRPYTEVAVLDRRMDDCASNDTGRTRVPTLLNVESHGVHGRAYFLESRW